MAKALLHTYNTEMPYVLNEIDARPMQIHNTNPHDESLGRHIGSSNVLLPVHQIIDVYCVYHRCAAPGGAPWLIIT